jgi:Zn-finger nucleic acid-binding protein
VTTRTPAAQKQCPRCREVWPLGTRFYRLIRSAKRTRWQSCCRACESEQKRSRRARA